LAQAKFKIFDLVYLSSLIDVLMEAASVSAMSTVAMPSEELHIRFISCLSGDVVSDGVLPIIRNRELRAADMAIYIDQYRQKHKLSSLKFHSGQFDFVDSWHSQFHSWRFHHLKTGTIVQATDNVLQWAVMEDDKLCLTLHVLRVR
jgi:hypothetical protein